MLRAVSERGAYANLQLAGSLRERGVTGQDAAMATELVYGTLRGQGTYDSIISVCAHRDLARIDPPLLEVLRLGTHQLLGMRVKPHAAVSTSVDLAAGLAGHRRAGFVNAVLRKIAARDLEAWIEIAAPQRSADPVGHLAVRYSHPRWMVGALAEALGEDAAGKLTETEAALAADQVPAAVTLAAVPGLCDRTELTAAGAAATRWSPFGAALTEGDPGGIAAVAQGRAAIVDEGSQLAVLAVARARAVEPGGRWLDLCAGPGGKARLLAGLAAAHGASLIAADLHEHRARLAAEAVGLAGTAGNTGAVVADGTRPAWRPATFDLVLADVPCSGLGSLRRRPDARWRRGPDDITALAGLQRALLASALAAARPGGVVGYVTCSPHLAETGDVLADVLAGHADVEVLDAPAILGEVPGLRCPGPFSRYAQFWPHRHGTDAMFVALLRRC